MAERTDRGAKRAVLLALVAVGAVVVYLAWPTEELSPRGRQREAYAHLGAILEQEQRIKGELGEYLSVGPAGPLPGEEPMAWPTDACPGDCRGERLAACATFACLEFTPREAVRFRYACRAIKHGDASDVTCAAVGDLDGDGALSLLVVGTSSTGHLVAPLPALGVELPETRCQPIDRVPSEVVYDCAPGVL